MTAAVVGDAPLSPRCQEEHLIFERVGAQRPAVTEHHRLQV